MYPIRIKSSFCLFYPASSASVSLYPYPHLPPNQSRLEWQAILVICLDDLQGLLQTTNRLPHLPYSPSHSSIISRHRDRGSFPFQIDLQWHSRARGQCPRWQRAFHSRGWVLYVLVDARLRVRGAQRAVEWVDDECLNRTGIYSRINCQFSSADVSYIQIFRFKAARIGADKNCTHPAIDRQSIFYSRPRITDPTTQTVKGKRQHYGIS